MGADCWRTSQQGLAVVLVVCPLEEVFEQISVASRKPKRLFVKRSKRLRA